MCTLQSFSEGSFWAYLALPGPLGLPWASRGAPKTPWVPWMSTRSLLRALEGLGPLLHHLGCPGRGQYKKSHNTKTQCLHVQYIWGPGVFWGLLGPPWSSLWHSIRHNLRIRPHWYSLIRNNLLVVLGAVPSGAYLKHATPSSVAFGLLRRTSSSWN